MRSNADLLLAGRLCPWILSYNKAGSQMFLPAETVEKHLACQRKVKTERHTQEEKIKHIILAKLLVKTLLQLCACPLWPSKVIPTNSLCPSHPPHILRKALGVFSLQSAP